MRVHFNILYKMRTLLTKNYYLIIFNFSVIILDLLLNKNETTL